MNLGKIPVVDTGKLGMMDRRLDPVPAGHVLLLFGSGDPIELTAGKRTDIYLRRRYPSFALVDTGPSDVEFTQAYQTNDNSFGYKITITARVRVAEARDFFEKYGAGVEVGAPLVDHWRMRISELVNRHGADGLVELQKYVTKMQGAMREAIADSAPSAGGIQLLACSFSVRETSTSVIWRELGLGGRKAVPGLKMRFPHRAKEIDQWITDIEAARAADLKERRENHDFYRDALRDRVAIAREMIDGEMIDPDSALEKIDRMGNSHEGAPPLLHSDGHDPDRKRLGGKSSFDEEEED